MPTDLSSLLPNSPSQLLPWAVALGILGLLLLQRIAGRWSRSWRARRQARHAQWGERHAAKLLKAAGYRLLDAQATRSYPLFANGEAVEVELRADFLLERDGRLFVADAKTGGAAQVRSRATRRQLLEYLIAYEADAVLLVDADRERIIEVGFPYTKPKSASVIPLLLSALIGAGATWFALTFVP